jgi:hypothetical protein
MQKIYTIYRGIHMRKLTVSTAAVAAICAATAASAGVPTVVAAAGSSALPVLVALIVIVGIFATNNARANTNAPPTDSAADSDTSQDQ